MTDESRDEPFAIKTRMIPRAYGGLQTPMGIFATGAGVFLIGFGDPGSEFQLQTDERGLDVIIDACHAAKAGPA